MLLWRCYQESAAITYKSALSAEDEADLDATIQTIADSHGYVSNLMQTLALAPKGLAAFAALSAYTRYGSELTPLQRELAIVIAVRDVHYGWIHHEPLARSVGLTHEQLLLIREGRVPKDLAPADHALASYAFEISAGRRVPPRVADGVHAHFTPRQIVDIALLTSFAMAVAALAIGLDIALEPTETLQFEQEWQQTRAAG